jgi:ubiquinone/menaquinone biosynthesis C-methylase UbiE
VSEKKGLVLYNDLDLDNRQNDIKLKKVYKKWASRYDFDNDNKLGTVSQPKSVQLLLSQVKDKATKIIDIGCGTGLVGKYLQAHGFNNFDGLDISDEMLQIASQRGYQKLYSGSLNDKLPIAVNSYDCAMCVGVFTHGHVASDGFSELCRIVRPGGYLCFTINEGVFQKYGFEETIKEFEVNNKWRVVSLYKDDYMTLENVKGYYCLATVN